MRIKLIQNLPVDDRHGMTNGRIFEVIRQGDRDSITSCFVMGDDGDEVEVFDDECEVVE